MINNTNPINKNHVTTKKIITHTKLHQETRTNITQSTSLFENYLNKQNSPINLKKNDLFQTLTYNQGGTYWGTVNYLDGQYSRNGFGRYIYCNGGMYDGQWKNDYMNGYGKLFYPDGQLAYEGFWKEAQFHGLGVQYNNSPTNEIVDYYNMSNLNDNWQRYEGNLQYDVREGMGKLIFSQNTFYFGHFQNDLPSGEGIFRSNINIKGKWHNGIFQSKNK